MGFSRKEYWSGLPCPSPGESSQPRDQTCVSFFFFFKPVFLMSPALAGGFFTTGATWEALIGYTPLQNKKLF